MSCLLCWHLIWCHMSLQIGAWHGCWGDRSWRAHTWIWGEVLFRCHCARQPSLCCCWCQWHGQWYLAVHPQQLWPSVWPWLCLGQNGMLLNCKMVNLLGKGLQEKGRCPKERQKWRCLWEGGAWVWDPTCMSCDSSRIHHPISSRPYCPTLPWHGLHALFMVWGASAFYVLELSQRTCQESGKQRWLSVQLQMIHCTHKQGQRHHGITCGNSTPIHPWGYHSKVDYILKVKSSVLLVGPVIAVSMQLPGCGQHPQCHMVNLWWI